MIKKLLLIICMLSLTRCNDKDEKNIQIKQETCFDIIQAGQGSPNTFLINKCTGETWTLLYEEYADTKTKGKIIGARTYKWMKIERSNEENIFRAF